MTSEGRSTFLLSGSLVLAVLAVGCGRSLSEEECRGLLDRYTDKLIDQSRPSVKPVERQDLLDQARSKASTDPEFLACPTRVRRSQYECAMDAPDVDAIERCLLL